MATSAMSLKRIKREILDLSKEDLGEITLTPSERSMYKWTGSIPGPTGSPYEGGVFKVAIELAGDYPFSAPKVQFTTPLYHPNVSSQGSICVDVLKNAWSPALSLYKVMLSLSSLLTDPNPKDPLVPAIAQEYLKNRATFDRKAKEWTQKHAMNRGTDGKRMKAASSPSGSSSASANPSASSVYGGVTADETSTSSPGLPPSSSILASIMSTFSRRPSSMTIPSAPMSENIASVGALTTPVENNGTRRSARNVRNPTTSSRTASRVPADAGVDVIVIDSDDEPAPSTIRAQQSLAGRKRSIDDEGRNSGRAVRRRTGGDEGVIIIDDD